MNDLKNFLPLSAGTGRSVVVDKCQVCGCPDLKSLLFLGFLPPVNTMAPIGSRPEEQPAYPAEILLCPRCQLVQLGLIVDPAILFPPHYAYTSGTTKILRENFAQLYQEVMELYPLAKTDLVVDVGSNDGTLLSNFQKGHRVCGIEPTNACKIAIERGIPTINCLFRPRGGGESARGSRSGSAGHRHQRLCAHREHSRDPQLHRGAAGAAGPLHFRVPLPGGVGGDAPVRHHLPRAPALLLAHEPEIPARVPGAGSRSRPAHPDARRLDPRLCRPQRHPEAVSRPWPPFSNARRRC